MSGPPGPVRAHGHAVRAQVGGNLGVIGIRREDKNKWERRAPLAPYHVHELVRLGFKVIVQPSTRRVYSDEEFLKAGAVLQEDLSECSTIAAVKEVPVDLLLPARTYLFFSHTIKAQPSGMPLLDAVLERKVRLVDYECITETGRRGGPRLVAFGAYAGYAGAIDFLRGLGERFLALGFSTPLLHIGSAFMYPSLEEAKRAVKLAGDAIRAHGLPAQLCPFVAVFTGSGKVATGALDIFKLLPHKVVDPAELPALCQAGAGASGHELCLAIATAEHMVRRRGGGRGAFDKAHYYAQPDQYEAIFEETVLPYATVIINGMYWDARFPRLFTHKDLHKHAVQGHDRLLGVCDITCDDDGSVPTRQFTSIEQPFYIYNALTESTTANLDEPGVLFHAVDHLPSELPREASEHFGNCLLQYLPILANSRAPEAPAPAEEAVHDSGKLPPQIVGAIIAEGGQLTPSYKYIQQLRTMNEKADAVEDDGEDPSMDAYGPTGLQGVALRMRHGTTAAPYSGPSVWRCITLELTGHLFDTLLINKVADMAEKAHARTEVLKIDVGLNNSEPSFASINVMAHTEEALLSLVREIKAAATKVGAVVRQAKSLDGNGDSKVAAGGPEAELGDPLAAPAVARRKILVLGAGFVSAPLVEFLLRRMENSLVVCSLVKKEVEEMAWRFGSRVHPQVMDITAEDAEGRDALVKDCDLVVSLVPATLHVGIARLAIKHRRPMVTASYVSEEMNSLHAEALAAGVLIINEVGLDPGIDHMSAMRMINEAKRSDGGRVKAFSSVCGGLPAPEAAGGNPLGYKFSWSPRGVLLASSNSARFMEGGHLQEVPGSELLSHAKPLLLNNAFALDVLPNRDSTAFADLYGLADAPTFFRGTLRYRGFCERMAALSHLGLLQVGPLPDLRAKALNRPSWTCRQWLATKLGLGELVTGAEVVRVVREILTARASPDSIEAGVDFVSWLGLFGDEPLPEGLPLDSPIDVVAKLLQRDEMNYAPGERDMVVMRHELLYEHRDGSQDRQTSTLIDYGEPNGATAMARTVGLTAAISAQLVLDGPPDRFGAGVQRPLQPEWYGPVSEGLEAEGIRLTETKTRVEKAPSMKLEPGGGDLAVAARL